MEQTRLEQLEEKVSRFEALIRQPKKLKYIMEIYKCEEAQVYVSKCELPVIYSQGRTKTEALSSLESAVTLFVKNLFKRN